MSDERRGTTPRPASRSPLSHRQERTGDQGAPAGEAKHQAVETGSDRPPPSGKMPVESGDYRCIGSKRHFEPRW